ncbi:MAG: capsular polysaccharide biosynthesis protein CapF [Clostridia bacterium]|nr:capsular polysaccharide biosynthesis protein CapF [Clostridia bacterium]
MKILVTGAKGFVGKNLCVALKTKGHTVYEYDIESTADELKEYCKDCEFVFHLAGVNRPKDPKEFLEGNCAAADNLLATLKEKSNKCPIMLSSSIQASLIGRYAGSDYGKSKLAGEELVRSVGAENGNKTLIYRFPNLFGKWCRPNYNSAVATFCHNIANGLPIQINDPAVELELLYIDDLINEMLLALEGKEHYCDYDGVQVLPEKSNRFCYVPTTHKVTLGEIADLLYKFAEQPKNLVMPEIPNNSFAKKLYSTYLSYLPKEKVAFPLKMNVDERGSFTELLKTEKCGQFSVNISKPNITKGQHWHHTKWEFFIVVSGTGLIQQRRVGDNEVLNFYVSGDKIEAVHMLPGYTHNIINLSETEDLVTLMWANEQFDKENPDTFYLPVEE